MRQDGLPAPQPFFRALAVTFVPEARLLARAEWAELERIVAEAASERSPRQRWQLRLLTRLVDWLPLLRYRRRFAFLHPRQRTRVLERLQDSRLALLRRGIWGLRTLVLLGYYARSAAAAEIGCRANVRGWEAR
jgi:hypothetical protein